MKVIFLKDVPRVGKRHDIKEVNDGYAMNFLLARGLAQKATPEAVKLIQQKQKEIIVEREVQDDLLIKNLEEISKKVIVIESKANEKGSLFSSIHPKEILEAMQKEHRASISLDSIVLEKPIKEIGEFEIPLSVRDKKSSFKLIVKPI